MLDESGTTIAVNAALERFAGDCPRCELRLGANFIATCEQKARAGARDRGAIADALRAMLAGEREAFSSHYALDPDERPIRWFGVRATLFCGEGPGRIVLQHFDSTAYVAMHAASRVRARLVDEIDAAVIAARLDGAIEIWSRGAEKVFGWSEEEVVGRRIADVIVAPEERAAAEVAGEELRRIGSRVSERTLRRRDGTSFTGHHSSAVHRDEDGEAVGLISVIVDITERVRAAQELREARDHLRAVTDSMGEALLTLDDAGHASYMNAAAERMLGWSLAEMRGRALHDVVHFRHADGTPHPIDRCPLAAGHRGREPVRVEDDTFVRRDGTNLPVSWVLTPFDSPAGKSSVIVFTDTTRAKAEQERLRSEIEQLSQVRDLHEALQEQRFELFAQPIIDLTTGVTVSHELLLRMRERNGRLRMPRTFLPVAERDGLIRELDRWVIDQAARLAGEGHHVELNVSAVSLGDPGLYDDFAAAVAEHDAPPQFLGVELTETAIMQDEAIARTFIERVGAIGCELALDDFGTGFGGFGYLKNLPVDSLKIDVEFVRDLRTNVASRHVVQAVVGLAASFGLRTVAEGVEDEETLLLIREMGVDHAQGYGIGRPAPLADTVYSAG